MLSQTVIAVLSASLIGRVAAQEWETAEAVTDNPVGRVYKAVLPDSPFFAEADIEGNVRGSITTQARDNGEGVVFKVSFENLPAEGGPFGYHLHDAPAEDGNCTSTKAHLDPYKRGQQPPCDKSAVETCEVGDLSGKHGAIPEGMTSFTAEYVDDFASTKEGIGAFFGNRSFVLHYANTTRLTCANFARVSNDSAQTTISVATTTTTKTVATASATGETTTTEGDEPTPTDEDGAEQTTDEPAAGVMVQASMPLLALAGVLAAYML